VSSKAEFCCERARVVHQAMKEGLAGLITASHSPEAQWEQPFVAA
jgi:hypothetical protein